MASRTVCAAALLGALGLPATSLAAPRTKPAKATAAQAANQGPQLSLEEIMLMLSSANGDEVRMAIEGAALLGSPEVIPVIAERVRAGLPSDLLEAALDTLVMLGDPRAGELFASLTSHRRPSVRLRAVQALVVLKAKDAEASLVRALGDAWPPVREAAADGLGELGATGSLDMLFVAFDRGVGGTGRALGRLAKPGDVPRLVAYLGRVPMTSLTPGFDALLTRRDLSEAVKLELVASLAELGTAEARGYLEGLGAKLPADTSPRVRRAIDEAVGRIAK